MTVTEAQKILGISPQTDLTEIKKQYRKLMHLAHPDASAFHAMPYPFSAQEINEAYELLYSLASDKTALEAGHSRTSHTASGRHTSGDSSFENEHHSQTFGAHKWYSRSHAHHTPHWNAPENPTAYTSRPIFHYAEGPDGEIIGDFLLTHGKYLWTLEEDFPLFLKSMLECSKNLLDEIDRNKKRTCTPSNQTAMQAQLAYLLAQQFIDGSETLKLLLTPQAEKDANIFLIPSMAELTDAFQRTASFRALTPGTSLYPAFLKNHRLFLKDAQGQTVGYLSFQDDRLYYIVIPLLEQKRAQVKMRISGKQEKPLRGKRNPYKNLDFWIRLPHENPLTFPENISLQIEKLLNDYAKS